MSTRGWTIWAFAAVFAAAALLPATAAFGQEEAGAAEIAQAAEPAGDVGTDVLTRPPRGSMAAQLRLKFSLQMSSGGTSLVASLDHNRHAWEMLSPEQRERFRSVAVAFLDKDPKQQEELLKRYSDFLALDKQKREQYRARAQWLRKVVATFTPEERKQLKAMSTEDRAKAIIARRDELVRQGKLTLSVQPTTRPATRSAE